VASNRAQHRRGFLVLTVLAIAAIIGAIAIGFLAYAMDDQHLQAAQAARDQAYFTAKSGVSWLATHPLTALAAQSDGTRVLTVGPHDRCTFSADAKTGVINCEGSVLDGRGRVLASRCIAVPPDNLEQAYEVKL
jgi:hypothetical protein